jgi:hypothetical protein
MRLSVDTVDAGNHPQKTFAKLGSVHVKSYLDMAPDYYWDNYYSFNHYSFTHSVSCTFFVTITDSMGRPVFFDYQIGMMKVGGHDKFYADWTIPFAGDVGTYTVRVYVWSDFLFEGTALSQHGASATFHVVEAPL